MVEAYAPGRELTCTVLGGPGRERALTVTEIVTDGWYDYEAKYAEGGSRHILPADIPPAIASACRDFALRAHRLLGCRGISRTDFRWDAGQGAAGLILLETNTQPGMTPTSLSPEQAAHAGITFGALCRELVEDASCDR
jgi:D-alanine-D-alanine ligase